MTNPTVYPAGLLPYGTDDDSVILQNPLTSLAAITGETGATGTVNGTVAYSTNGVSSVVNSGYAKFIFSAANSALLEKAGQISFDIDYSGVSRSDTGGLVLDTTHAYFLSWAGTDSGSASPFGRVYKKFVTNALPYVTMNNAADQNFNSATQGEDRGRITISWHGSQMSAWIDGRIMLERRTFTRFTDMFKVLWICGNRGTAVQSQGIEISNLLVSTRPAMLPTHHLVKSVTVVGHSFVSDWETPYPQSSRGWDKSAGRAMRGYLTNRGFDTTVTYHANPGSTVIVGSGDDMSADITAAAAENADIAVMVAGANDVNYVGYVEATFDTQIKAYITELLAASDIVIVNTVATSLADTTVTNATVTANTVSANTVINALVSWWDTANPTDTGRVIVADLFTELGGESLGSGYFDGEYDGTYLDRHLAPTGNKRSGELVARKIFEYILR